MTKHLSYFCNELEANIRLCGNREIVVMDDLDSWCHPTIQNFSGESPSVISSFRTKERPAQVSGYASEFLKECQELLAKDGDRPVVVWSDFGDWEAARIIYDGKTDRFQIATDDWLELGKGLQSPGSIKEH